METFLFLLSTEYLLFTICLSLSLILGIFFLIVGGVDDDLDFDIEEAPLLNTLGFGKVPVLVGIFSILTAFGSSGILLQTLLASYFYVMPWFIVAAPSFVLSIFLTRKLNNFIAKNLPSHESYDVKLSDLINKSSKVVLPALSGSVTEAKVVDDYGKTHYIRLKLSKNVATGDELVITKYDDKSNVFYHG